MNVVKVSKRDETAEKAARSARRSRRDRYTSKRFCKEISDVAGKLHAELWSSQKNFYKTCNQSNSSIFYSRVIASANVLPPEDPHDVLADAAPQSLLGQAGTLQFKVVPVDRGRGQAVGVALDGLGVDNIVRLHCVSDIVTVMNWRM